MLARRHGLPVGGDSLLAKRHLVADRVDLEQVLIDKPEADHPRGESHRVRRAAVARGCVQLEQLPCQVADRSVGVIGVLDHLHHVADRSLQQLDQLGDGELVARRRSSSTTGRAACADPELSP